MAFEQNDWFMYLIETTSSRKYIYVKFCKKLVEELYLRSSNKRLFNFLFGILQPF